MTASTATKKLAVRNKSTLTIGEDYIEGTIADILGIAKTVGTAERAEGTRGPKPAIIRIPTNIPGMVVARR